MKIIVCIKQVPDTTKVSIDPKTGTLKREGVPSIINPEDQNALEMALQIDNAEITVVSMGPPQAEKAIRTALAMGADKGILLTDKAFAAADTLATSQTLSAAIKLLDYDLILCGRQAIDGDTAQIGPQLAESLKIPQVTYVEDIKITGQNIECTRNLDTELQKVETILPCLITVLKSANQPRYPNLGNVKTAFEKDVLIWDREKISLTVEECGLKASPTWVKKTYTPDPKGKGQIMHGSSQEIVKSLIKKLKEKNILR